ncbi:MAG: hypothetical protein HC945_04155, partial [Nitrosarchaeum sp.]|nr:hypothetical protein [Nitrosarchaeum sp.]
LSSKGTNNETGSCGTLAGTSYANVNTTPPGRGFCSAQTFRYTPETSDTMRFDVYVNFSQDIPQGAHQATFTAVCDDT